MSDIVLLLGPVTFTDFEVPAGITFGGEQRLALHRLPGGTRVIDALGRDDAALTFTGIFSGSDATLRARAIDELRSLGLPLPLTWDIFFYSVVIDNFQADYRNSNWIPYRISCTVIRDEAAALIEAAVSLTTSTLADVSTAFASAASAGVNLSGTQSAITAPGATTSGTAAFAAARSCLASTQRILNTNLAASEQSLLGANLIAAPSADAGIAGLSQATGAAGQLSQITHARSYLGRAAVNLTNAST
jgi:hypothetical protein